MREVTQILSRIEKGDPNAAEQLLPLIYDELRKLATANLAQRRTLPQPKSLVYTRCGTHSPECKKRSTNKRQTVESIAMTLENASVLVAAIVVMMLTSGSTSAQNAPNENASEEEPKKAVTIESFAEAEVDARFFRFLKEGGMNRGIVYDTPTPTNRQAVPRMNRDTLYMGIPIDTSKGYAITVPKHPDNRYVSVYVIDNEHMTLHVLKGSGVKHTLGKEHTRYVIAIPRVQVFNAKDDADVAAAAAILGTMKVESGSKEPKPMVNWDWEAMMELRAQYEEEFKTVTQYPKEF